LDLSFDRLMFMMMMGDPNRQLDCRK